MRRYKGNELIGRNSCGVRKTPKANILGARNQVGEDYTIKRRFTQSFIGGVEGQRHIFFEPEVGYMNE